ncbi:uncharacterized protein BYT42DRAFT_566511, partial [Radiomyces spectabilis]|uniref:uncharacterized protein n=1 Tax=Radiomyces spectabilis TaxID=64574 RepID=UPI0022206137
MTRIMVFFFLLFDMSNLATNPPRAYHVAKDHPLALCFLLFTAKKKQTNKECHFHHSLNKQEKMAD